MLIPLPRRRRRPLLYFEEVDSLKNWNNHFFWIDTSVCPLSIPWFDGTSVVKDPLSMDEVVDLPCVERLNENRTLIRKLRDPCKVKTGERTLAENEVSLITETDDRVIVPSSQPLSLVDHTIQDELNVNSGRRKKKVAFAFGSPLAKKARTEGVVISNSRPSTAGKSPSALQRLSRQNEQASTGSRSAAPATEDDTSSSVTPTPEFSHEDVSHDNVRTRPASGRFVVLSSGSSNANIHASPHVVPPVTLDSTGVNALVPAPTGGDHRSSGSGPEAGILSATPSQDSSVDDFYESQTIDSAAAQNVYVPNWNVINNDRLASPVTCRNLLDHVTHPAYWATLHNQHDAMFLDVVNVNSAQHVCMISELRLRYEHEILIRENFKKKFTDSVVVIQQRNVDIVDLNVRLEKSKAEAAEVIELRKRVSDLEATVAVKVGELANLRTEKVGLVEKVSALESERDGLKNQVVGERKMREEFALQRDAAEQHFEECASELDARIADVRRDMDNDLYPHMLTAIAGRRWVIGHGLRLAVYKCARSVECQSAMGKVILTAINKGIQQGLEAGVVHGKAGRSLVQLEAYDPKVEGKYVVAVFEFENVSFLLLDELESLKDALLASIMSTLVLKDDQGNVDAAPEFAHFQPFLDQVFVPIYSDSGFVDHEMLLSEAIPFVRRSTERRGLCPLPPAGTSGSVPPPGSSLNVTDYQVLFYDGGLAVQPPVARAHDDLFDTSVLDGAGA
ncbi:hypothetical protein Tco_1345083 [Tanacetum coccineum]